MGVGAWLSRFIDERLERAFVLLQMSIALVGGFSALVLFYAFAYIQNYQAFLYLITISLGTMLGVEIPLIIRILKESFSLKTNISNVFTLDYIGALIAALLFPLVLVPQLGLMQTSFVFGLLNLLVGLMAWSIFREMLGRRYLVSIITIGIILVAGLWESGRLISIIENKLYQDNIIYSEQTPYQKLIITAQKGRIKFYINGAIQFDSIDEYRYHESLVHPVMHTAKAHERILIIGGGDGMALREILRYDDVGKITLVDLDPAITKLFRKHKLLSKLNNHAYDSGKVTVINQDAWKFIEQSTELYDVIIVDLPDPNNLSLGRLYSQTFYHLLSSHLSLAGAMVTQSTSPMFSRKAFWCIEQTVRDSGLQTLPYHTYVPSFGEWGFVLSSHIKISTKPIDPSLNLRYIDDATLERSRVFPMDIAKLPVDSNQLSTHKLIYYYEEGWRQWYDR
jgi:spermidine synthase